MTITKVCKLQYSYNPKPQETLFVNIFGSRKCLFFGTFLTLQRGKNVLSEWEQAFPKAASFALSNMIMQPYLLGQYTDMTSSCEITSVSPAKIVPLQAIDRDHMAQF